MDNEIVERPNSEMAMAAGDGSMSIEQASKYWERFRAFVKTQLRTGVDYGSVTGASGKPGLFRPGAEKILKFYGYGAELNKTPETVIDWKTPFFHYAYTARVFHFTSGKTVATAEGSANSLEDKFRYIWVPGKKVPTSLDMASLETRDGKYGTLYRVPVPDIFSQVNNIQKRGGKRALVAATLIGCAASDFFSQDEEGEEGDAAPDSHKTSGSESHGHSDGNSDGHSGGNAPSGDKISEAQGKRLYAICKGAGKSDDEIKAYLKDKHGLTTTRDVTKDVYESICNWGAQK